MSRFVLLVLLMAGAAAAGCQSAEKSDAVGASEPSRWKMPAFIYQDDWWGPKEMAGLDR